MNQQDITGCVFTRVRYSQVKYVTGNSELGIGVEEWSVGRAKLGVENTRKSSHICNANFYYETLRRRQKNYDFTTHIRTFDGSRQVGF